MATTKTYHQQQRRRGLAAVLARMVVPCAIIVLCTTALACGGRGGNGSGRGHAGNEAQGGAALEEQLSRQSRQARRNGELVYPCPDHIFPFCTDENPFGITYKSGTKGKAAFPRDANIGCLGTAPGPTWFYMQIAQPGDLLIYIEQTSARGVQLDVDFACWGPFEAASKREFLDKLCEAYYPLHVDSHPNHRPANGNHHGDTGGYPFGNLVDCSYDPAGTEWCYIPQAQTGEWYLLLLTNYSRKPGTIHFERVAEQSTATTNCSVVAPITLRPEPRGLLRVDDHTTAICLHERKALVSIELEPDEGYTLTETSLRSCEVTVYANGREYRATLEDGHFDCEIDILSDTTAYSAIVTCSDPTFELNTETYRIIRTEDCDPSQVPLVEGTAFHAGDLSAIELLRADRPVVVDLDDPDGVQRTLPEGTAPMNLEDYEVSVAHDYVFIRRTEVRTQGNKVELMPEVRGDWCRCFIPDSLTFLLQLTPKDGGARTTYRLPLRVGITDDSPWLARCLWVLVAMTALLALALYLLALLKKNRFHQQARLRNSYFVEDSPREVQKGGKPLRRAGLGAWMNRWLNPFGDERCTMSFTRPRTGAMTFVASPSKNRVLMTASSFDARSMTVPNYTPPPQNQRRRGDAPISITAGTSIEIKKMQGTTATRLGHLKYVVEGPDDTGRFQFLCGVLIALCLLAILVLAVMIMR